MAAPHTDGHGRSTSIVDLPPELRSAIFHLSLITDMHVIVDLHDIPDPPPSASAVQNSGDLIEYEASMIYFGTNIFRPNTIPAMHKFLEYVGPTRLHMLRCLELGYSAPRDAAAVANWRLSMSWVNSLHEYSQQGLRADAVCIVTHGTQGRWTRISTAPEFAVVGKQGGWQVELSEEQRKKEASAPKPRQVKKKGKNNKKAKKVKSGE